ncbi:MAG: MFS transporter [Nocardioidaceae bacterium]
MHRGRSGDSPIRLLQATAFVATLDRFAMPPILVAIARGLDVPLGQVVQAAGIYFLAYGLMQPVWGMVSDWLGLVRTMRLTLLAAAGMTVMAAFVWDPVSLALTRGLAGGFFGAAFPSTLIYVGDTVAAKNRQHEVTRLMVGVALGTASASVAAGVVADLFTWRAAFVGTGIAALVLTWLLRGLPSPTVRRTHTSVWSPLRLVARSRITLLVLGLAFVEGAVLLGSLTVLPPAVEAAGASAAVAGTVTAAYGVAVYGFARLVGALSRRYDAAWLIALGGAAALVACMVMAVSQAPWVATVVAALLGLAWAGMHSSLQTWATEVMPDNRATVVSLFAGSLFVGSAVAAVLVSGLADAGRYGEIFALAAMAVVPLAVVATWSRARWRAAGKSPVRRREPDIAA